MRICIIASSLLLVPARNYGGAEMVIFDLCEALAEQNHDVTLVAPKGSYAKNCKVIETIIAPERTDVNWIELEKQSYNIYKDELPEFEILNDHSWFGFSYLSKLDPVNKDMRICKTMHGHFDWRIDRVPDPIKPVNLIAISDFMRREYETQGWTNTRYAYNGINLDRYTFYDGKRDNSLVYVGRLSRIKGAHVALKVAQETNTPIDIIGGSFIDANEKEFLEAIKTECENSDGLATLHLDLAHDKKVEFLQHAKACLIPSNFGEPFGLCLHPDTKIVTDTGIKTIVDVTENDNVLTHAGRFRKVLETTVREYSGDLIAVKSYGVPKSITTPEHPYLVMKRRGNTGFFDKPEWISAENISKGDVILTPVITDVEDVDEISVNVNEDLIENGVIIPTCVNQYGATHRQLNANPIPEKVLVTPDLMRLFGYYLAEGSCKTSVNFTFHRDETKYVEDVCNILTKTFNVHPTVQIRKTAKVANIIVSSKVLCAFLRDLFGSGAYNKRIPSWMIKLPHYKQVELVKGMWRGDGCRDKYTFRYHTVSPSLSWGYSEILMRCGISNRVSKQLTNGFGRKHIGKTRDIYCNSISGESADVFAKLIGEETRPFKSQRKSMFKRRVSGDTIYSLVDSVTKEPFAGKVYNLSIDEDETYCTESHLVHNCAPESLATGTPVVCWADGALPEIINAPAIGSVCSTYDAFLLAVRTIDDAKYDPLECRKRAEVFSRENMAANYVKLYEEVIAGKGW